MIRREQATGAASRALFGEYMELVRERAGADFQPVEHIFATPDAFSGTGAAWLVFYDGDTPVACGGLRPLDDGTSEIKRMFVTRNARRQGLASRMLSELEDIARDAGQSRIRLLTTELLPEAIELYRKTGYAIVSSHIEDGHTDYWMEKSL